MRRWFILVFVILGGFVLVAALWRLLLVLVAVGLVGAGLYLLYGQVLRRRFRARWSIDRPILLVYSNSPHWQSYIETNWLPRVGKNAVVLNWSERSKWMRDKSVESRVFRYYATDREFNPMVIYFPRRGRMRIIRFWAAFKDFKHGKDAKLRRAEAELFAITDELQRATP